MIGEIRRRIPIFVYRQLSSGHRRPLSLSVKVSEFVLYGIFVLIGDDSRNQCGQVLWAMKKTLQS